MRVSKRWSEAETDQLIAFLGAHHEFWDPCCSNYRNRPVKRRVVEWWANHFGTHYAEIQRKIASLRNQFSNEFEKMTILPDGTKQNESKWRHYQALSFLKLFKQPCQPACYTLATDYPETSTVEVKSRKRKASTKSIQSTQPSDSMFDNPCQPIESYHLAQSYYTQQPAFPQDVHWPSNNFATYQPALPPPPPPQPAPPQPVPPQEPRNPTDRATLEASYQQFGEFIASELRIFPTEQAKQMKSQILQLIIAASME